MVDRMKTTIELPDDLLQQAKTEARRRGTTLRRLLEAGLRHVLASKDPASTFRLPDHRDGKGGGFVAGVDPHDWSRVRDIIYAARGS